MPIYTGELTYCLIDISEDNQNSTAFVIPKYATFVGVAFPTMDNGDVSLELTLNGTDYYPVFDPATGTDLLVCDATYDPGWVDISDYIRFIPRSVNRHKLRFYSATIQTADRTLAIMFK